MYQVTVATFGTTIRDSSRMSFDTISLFDLFMPVRMPHEIME